MWLWPSIMQRELDKFRRFANNRRVRKQKDKALPSGVTPNFSYNLPERFGGRDCLQPVNVAVVEEILQDMEEQKNALTDWGVPPVFAARAEAASIQAGIRIQEVTMDNAWSVFALILRVLEESE